MVAGEARGAGVGRLLGEWVVDWHRRAGFEGIQFNAVVASNVVAVGLWRSLGFG
jgi:GNAT superfamily N-acetyltransferase